jgi:mono/diheme cytochrome c family protein
MPPRNDLRIDPDQPRSSPEGLPRFARAGRIARAAALPGLATLLLGAADPAARAPDPRRGEALYVGATPLLAGGAPCLGCHGIAGHGLARAASFGPDLSGAHQQYGADGLESLLEDIVFPSMQPVYRGHAVTKEERADLVAFLGETTGAPAPALGAGFGGGIAAAMAGFLALVVAIGRRGSRRARAGEGETP